MIKTEQEVRDELDKLVKKITHDMEVEYFRAIRDATVWGVGYIEVDTEGNFKHIPTVEIKRREDYDQNL